MCVHLYVCRIARLFRRRPRRTACGIKVTLERVPVSAEEPNEGEKLVAHEPRSNGTTIGDKTADVVRWDFEG